MIHYHGTPVSGSGIDAAAFLAGRHALVPFPNPDNLAVVAEVCQSFVIDNGAFTAWKQGGSIDVKAYKEFCDEWSRHPSFDWCLIPDVIDGSEQDNREAICEWSTTMPSYLIESVPVWHFHESIGHLRGLANRFRVVALGSSGQWPTPGTDSWWERVAEFMPAICDGGGRPQCKLHGLRMLNPEIFTRLPLASADSTNAVRNASNFGRFGSYLPPTSGQRMTVIADRIERFQSVARWVYPQKPAELWSLCQ